MLFVRNGKITLDGEQLAAADMALMSQAGEQIKLQAMEACDLLLMGGEPINEPIVAHGPFVMNTDQEIRAAIMDYQSGKMGKIAAR